MCDAAKNTPLGTWRDSISRVSENTPRWGWANEKNEPPDGRSTRDISTPKSGFIEKVSRNLKSRCPFRRKSAKFLDGQLNILKQEGIHENSQRKGFSKDILILAKKQLVFYKYLNILILSFSMLSYSTFFFLFRLLPLSSNN